MKIRSFFVVLIFLMYVSARAQIQEIESSDAKWTTVGQVKWLANTKASLKYFVTGSDTTYLMYLQDEEKLKNNRDMTVHQYFSISFEGTDNTAAKLYELLISFFSKENKKNKGFEKTFQLGKELVMVRYFPRLTSTAISFSTTKNSIVFTEKEINKLFNRK